MRFDIHHFHVFASDIERSVAFYRDHFGGEVVMDLWVGGRRNVFMRLGEGKLHLIDQAPESEARGGLHHLGVRTDDLDGAHAHLKAAGVELPGPIGDYGPWRFLMVPAPDGVMIELFEVDDEQAPPQLRGYFD